MWIQSPKLYRVRTNSYFPDVNISRYSAFIMRRVSPWRYLSGVFRITEADKRLKTYIRVAPWDGIKHPSNKFDFSSTKDVPHVLWVMLCYVWWVSDGWQQWSIQLCLFVDMKSLFYLHRLADIKIRISDNTAMLI